MFEPYSDWAIISVFVVIYSLIGGRIGRTWISDAMVFVFTGLLLGPVGLGMLQFNVTSENVKTVTELTLALILFNDAAVESGLNDGICVPLLLALLAVTTGGNSNSNPVKLVTILFLEEIGIGLLVGVSFSVITNQLREFFQTRNWIAPQWQPVLALALALACFSTAQHFGGSGFIACFVGGLTFGTILKQGKEELLMASEAVGDNLSLITWVAFGSSLVILALRQQTWLTFLYAVLSLTVIRMLPVFLVLFGMKLDKWTKLFVGWFGPRGLASIVFAVIVFDAKLPHSQEIVVIVNTTIILSVLAHGLTANPLVNLYGKWIDRQNYE